MMLGARVGEWVAQAGAGMPSWLAQPGRRALLLGGAPHSRRGVSACACVPVACVRLRCPRPAWVAAATWLSRGSQRAGRLARRCIARIDTGAASGGSTSRRRGGSESHRHVATDWARAANGKREGALLPHGTTGGCRARTLGWLAGGVGAAGAAAAGRRRLCAPSSISRLRQTSLTSSSPTQLSSPHTTHARRHSTTTPSATTFPCFLPPCHRPVLVFAVPPYLL